MRPPHRREPLFCLPCSPRLRASASRKLRSGGARPHEAPPIPPPAYVLTCTPELFRSTPHPYSTSTVNCCASVSGW